MTPIKIKGATSKFMAPKSWKEEKHGRCDALPVRLSEWDDLKFFESAWQPSEDEMRVLNAGGSVRLTVVGCQPPVSLDVDEA